VLYVKASVMRFLLISEREELLGFTVAVSERQARAELNRTTLKLDDFLGNSPERGINHSLSDRRTWLRLAVVSRAGSRNCYSDSFPKRRVPIGLLCPGGGNIKIRFIIRLVPGSGMYPARSPCVDGRNVQRKRL
jgi:hypothetical protein